MREVDRWSRSSIRRGHPTTLHLVRLEPEVEGEDLTAIWAKYVYDRDGATKDVFLYDPPRILGMYRDYPREDR